MSDHDKILSMPKNVEMISQFIPFDMNQKTLLTKIMGEMQKHAVAVCRELGLDAYARMDFLLNDKNEMFCLEANTLPGMTPTSLLPQEAQALGMDFADLCEKLIAVSAK